MYSKRDLKNKLINLSCNQSQTLETLNTHLIVLTRMMKMAKKAVIWKVLHIPSQKSFKELEFRFLILCLLSYCEELSSFPLMQFSMLAIKMA